MEILPVHPDILKEIDTQNHRRALEQSHAPPLPPAIHSDWPDLSQTSGCARQHSSKLLYELGHSLVTLGIWLEGQNAVHSS